MFVAIAGFALAFLAGVLSKITDSIERKKSLSALALLAGFSYGLAYAMLLSFGTEFATLFLGIAIAVILAGKIDSLAHQFAIAGFLSMLVFSGFPPTEGFNVALLFSFAIVALADEKLNDFASKGKRKNNRLMLLFGKYRLLLEFSAIIVGFAFQNWVYLAALLCFDAGYLIAGLLKGGKNG